MTNDFRAMLRQQREIEKQRERLRKALTHYGVFEHHENGPNGTIRNTFTGYVVRDVESATGMSAATPYRYIEPVKVYVSEKLAQRHADKLNERYTIGEGPHRPR